MTFTNQKMNAIIHTVELIFIVSSFPFSREYAINSIQVVTSPNTGTVKNANTEKAAPKGSKAIGNINIPLMSANRDKRLSNKFVSRMERKV